MDCVEKSKEAASREFGVYMKQIQVWYSQKDLLVVLKKWKLQAEEITWSRTKSMRSGHGRSFIQLDRGFVWLQPLYVLYYVVVIFSY